MQYEVKYVEVRDLKEFLNNLGSVKFLSVNSDPSHMGRMIVTHSVDEVPAVTPVEAPAAVTEQTPVG